MAEKFIQSAIKHPGALHKQLGVPEGKKIPEAKLRAAAKKGGKLGQRARFAETLKGISRKAKTHKHGRLTDHGKHKMKLMAGKMLNYGKGKAN